MNTRRALLTALFTLAGVIFAVCAAAQEAGGDASPAGADVARTSGGKNGSDYRPNTNLGAQRILPSRTFIWEGRNPEDEFWPANGERIRGALAFQQVGVDSGDWRRFVGKETITFWTARFSLSPVRFLFLDISTPGRYELSRKLHSRINMAMDLSCYYYGLRLRPDFVPFIKPYAGLGWSRWQGTVHLKDEFHRASDGGTAVGTRYTLGADLLIESSIKSMAIIAPSAFVEYIYDKAAIDFGKFGEFTLNNHGFAIGLGMVMY